MSAFVQKAVALGAPVALVTSGGTTVPLEKNTVRFLDNFSSGTRGAVSAEVFLSQGYHVVFLHRQHSLQPFVRWIQNDHLLHSYQCNADGTSISLHGHPEAARAIRELEQHRNQLLQISFVSVHEYLHLFRALCSELRAAGPRGLVYACAAVSDFYLPESKMAHHKIQSRGHDNGLTLSLDPVPKLLGELAQYCPQAFKVTFKLETDASILDGKAVSSLKAYGQDVVVGNLLSSHRVRVKLFFRDGSTQVVDKDLASDDAPIEDQFVAILIQAHKSSPLYT